MNKFYDVEFAKQLCNNDPTIIMESNYIKHGNFVIIDNINNKVFKVYQNEEYYKQSLYKFDWAFHNINNFLLPTILKNYQLNNKHIIEFNLLKQIKDTNPIDKLDHFIKLYNIVEELGKVSHIKYTDNYELKNEYEQIFECKDYILTHGDLNHKNIFKTLDNIVAVIDWDNLSYQPRELVETTTVLYFLSHPRFHDKFFNTLVSHVLQKFSTVKINKLIELTKKKNLISVTDSSKKYWNDMNKKFISYKKGVWV